VIKINLTNKIDHSKVFLIEIKIRMINIKIEIIIIIQIIINKPIVLIKISKNFFNLKISIRKQLK